MAVSMATFVRPRTAPAPHSEALRQERRPISLLQPEVFPNLERFHGFGTEIDEANEMCTTRHTVARYRDHDLAVTFVLLVMNMAFV